MIVREYGEQRIVCDECEVNEKLIEHDFAASVAEARAEDWKIVQSGGTWRHTCPACEQGASRLARTKALFGLK